MRVVVLWLIPIFAVAYLLRTAAILVLGNRHPKVGAVIDRWWAWVPFAVVLCLVIALLIVVTINVPLLGVVLSAAVVVGLYVAFFSAGSVGSPFRPRR